MSLDTKAFALWGALVLLGKSFSHPVAEICNPGCKHVPSLPACCHCKSCQRFFPMGRHSDQLQVDVVLEDREVSGSGKVFPPIPGERSLSEVTLILW